MEGIAGRPTECYVAMGWDGSPDRGTQFRGAFGGFVPPDPGEVHCFALQPHSRGRRGKITPRLDELSVADPSQSWGLLQDRLIGGRLLGSFLGFGLRRVDGVLSQHCGCDAKGHAQGQEAACTTIPS